MSKPFLDISITTRDEKTATVKAVFDSGSFYTIIREDRLPSKLTMIHRRTPHQFNTAAQGGKLNVTGDIPLVMNIGEKMIEDLALVSPDLSQDMLIGAKTMQSWHITIDNQNGETRVIVGLDMRDPDIIEVD